MSRAAVNIRVKNVRRTAHPEQIGANRDTIGKLAKVQVPGTATQSMQPLAMAWPLWIELGFVVQDIAEIGTCRWKFFIRRLRPLPAVTWTMQSGVSQIT